MFGPFSSSLWPGLALWLALYTSDLALTLKCAKLYRAQEQIRFAIGYELTPYYQKQIEQLKVVSFRFIYALASSSALLAVVWFASNGRVREMGLYLFCLGAFILPELAVHLRHVRNYYLFKHALKSGLISGSISYAASVTYKSSALELLSFAALYLVLFAVVPSAFFLGGVVSCLSASVKHYTLARKATAREQQHA